MSECIFCRIVQGMAPARVIYRDEEITAFHDINPQAPVHILIIPNRHITSVACIEPGDANTLGRLFLVARQLAEQENITDGYRIVVNSGRMAGQSVYHLHMHLLGGRRLSWPPG
ncbi:MAG: histidine triad nucleotide-binding protein [Anaerolineae bacterium]|nr:histidine triad nucleotide-binding protein [Anaerolineae bacterium]